MFTDHYTHGHADSVLRSHRWRTAANSAAYLLPHLNPGVTVLDIGCGPGTITVDLARTDTTATVVGVDMGVDVVAEAVAHAREATVTNASFAAADIHHLPFPDNTFDVVHAHQVLQHLSDPVAALHGLQRVVKPGGLVAARDADYAAMAWFPRLPALDSWMALYQQVARSNAAEPDAGRFLRHWAHSAGFDRVTSSASVWCYATESERQWWGGLWADRVLHSHLAEQAVAKGFADGGQLAEIAEGWRDWAASPDAWFAVLHGEIICRV